MRIRLGLALAVLAAPAIARAATITVSNTNDSGAGSLRQAILTANATGVADTIRFAIPGSGVHKILPTTALPEITSPVKIDGFTQQTIEVSFTSAPAGINGFHVTGGGTTIQGLAINGLTPELFGGGGVAILLEGGGDNQVFGCIIGTNTAGTAKIGAGSVGVQILNSGNNVVGQSSVAPTTGPLLGNRIAGNFIGVSISGTTSTGNLVKGNTIGRFVPAGPGNGNDGVLISNAFENQVVRNSILGNGNNGVEVTTGAANNLVGGNVIGDVHAVSDPVTGNDGDGIRVTNAVHNTIDSNLIVASVRNGILIFDDSAGNVVIGNSIGFGDHAGVDYGNALSGILVSGANDNQIGSTSPIEANRVCGNGTNGIRLRSGASGNVVRGNLVGLYPSGSSFAVLGNGDDGIELNDEAVNNIVGGKAPGAGNVIVANAAAGIRIADATTTGNVIQGNVIGTDPTGASSLPNGAHGIWIQAGAHDNAIGGKAAGAGNVIAFSGGDGVFVEQGTGNAILGNSIRGNTGLGIDLAPEGVTGNDAGDADSGSNLLQNFPELAEAASSGTTTTVSGSLESAAGTLFRVEFFGSVLCDASGHGEGRFFLGSTDVTTDAGGHAAIAASFDVAAKGPFVSATATDPGGNTSEFSACVAIPGPTVSSVSPTSGPASGGTPITINGSNFQQGAAALVGESAASGALWQSDAILTATTPALAPGVLHDVQVVNVNTLTGGLPKAWFADFSDVPQAHLFHGAIEKIFRAGITTGCGGGNYCLDDPVNRAAMAAFLLRGEHGSSFHPPDPTGQVFGDVPLGTFLGDWIELLGTEKITTGCGSGNFCPEQPVTRAGMAVFLLRIKHGADYKPPAAQGNVFDDVPLGTFLGEWIEQLAAEGITTGCGTKLFCPEQSVTRGEMAVFLARAFGL